MTNKTDRAIVTGDRFELEKWTGKSWNEEPITVNALINDIGYKILPGTSMVLETKIGFYYPNLSKGKYRIYKDYLFFDERHQKNLEKGLIFTEFEIQ